MNLRKLSRKDSWSAVKRSFDHGQRAELQTKYYSLRSICLGTFEEWDILTKPSSNTYGLSQKSKNPFIQQFSWINRTIRNLTKLVQAPDLSVRKTAPDWRPFPPLFGLVKELSHDCELDVAATQIFSPDAQAKSEPHFPEHWQRHPNCAKVRKTAACTRFYIETRQPARHGLLTDLQSAGPVLGGHATVFISDTARVDDVVRMGGKKDALVGDQEPAGHC